MRNGVDRSISRVHPKKSLGQHFVSSRAILGRVAAAAEIGPGDVVVEIGAGRGSLTRILAEVAGRVIAVEVDEALAELLGEELASLTSVEVIEGDILTMDIADLVGRGAGVRTCKYKVVGNIPYYITSALLRQVLETKPPPCLAVLMVQWEVAQRIIAGPGHMSVLSVSVQFYGEPQIVAKVPASAFYPPPKVDSAILRIDLHDTLPTDESEIDAFFTTVRAGFAHRRKQLRNSLHSTLRIKATALKCALERANIDGRRRAQTLSMAEWVSLHHSLASEIR